MHVSIASEKLFTLFGLTISNTIVTAVIVVFLISIFIFILYRKLSYDTPGKTQILFEMVVEYLGGMVENLLGKVHAHKILGFLFTFMFFILISNWFGLLPIVPNLVIANKTHETKIIEETSDEHVISKENTESPITFGTCFKERNCFLTLNGIERLEHTTHVLRAPTTDLSMTISLAILAVIATNFSGFYALKLKYLGKFFNFSNAIDGVVGILELLSEFIKIISFSFRLFGNIFAGELLLIIMTSLTYGLATLPFLFFETFVGLIQAFVFFILLAIFISLAVEDHSQH